MANDNLALMPLREVPSVKVMLMNKHAADQIKAVAGYGVRPEQLMRHMIDCLHRTPKLAECDPRSMLSALMTCAELGFIPNSPLGTVFLIPFGRKVELVLGYKGLMTLAIRSGDVKSIQAGVATREEVERKDFDWRHGSGAFLHHKATVPDGEPAFAWALADMATGGEQFVVLPWAEVIKTRDGSSGWQSAVKFNKTKSNPWFTNEREMGTKTAIRRLSRFLPLSPAAEHGMSLAMQSDESTRIRADVGYGAPDDGPDDGEEGQTIEGKATEAAETNPAETRKAAPAKPKPQPRSGDAYDPREAKPKTEPAKKPAPKAEPEPERDDSDEFAQARDTIVSEYAAAETLEGVTDVDAMFRAEIEQITAMSKGMGDEIADARQAAVDAIEGEN